MKHLNSFGSGALLAFGNVYGALSAFVVLSIVFNSVDLKTFGSISLLLTSVSICQILFNTQSWQGLLNTTASAEPKLLRCCLAIDIGVAAIGTLLLVMCHIVFSKTFFPNPAPFVLLLIAINVALTPPGALIAVIRQEGRFARQAMVDISAATLKIILALVWLPGATSLLPVALTLVIPELLRWSGYLALSAPRLAGMPTATTRTSFGSTARSPTLRAIYGFSAWGMLTEISHLPTAHIDKLMVSAFLGLESLAIWDILKRCATAVVQGTTVINQMLFPYFVRVRGDLPAADLIHRCLRHCLILSSLLLLFYGVAVLSMPIWFPKAFHVDQAVWPLDHLQRVFGLLALVMTFVLGATPVHPLFLSLRHSSQNFRISLVGNLVFFALSYLMLPFLGLFGTSLAIFGSDAFIILTKFHLLRPSKSDAVT